MKENDIIGFRANSPLVYFGISFLVGLALIAVCIIVPLGSGRGLAPWMIVLLILGAILFCIGAVCFVRVLKTPDPAIYVEDGKLCIADTCIPIGMIVDVRCRPAKSRLITYTWGQIVVEYQVGEAKCNYVALVEDAFERIQALIGEYEKREGGAL